MSNSMKSLGLMTAMAIISGGVGMATTSRTSGGNPASGGMGSNRSKARWGYSFDKDDDIPKGHDKFSFTEEGECFNRIDLANARPKPVIFHEVIAINQKRAIKQFKADIKEAEAMEDIKPGDECITDSQTQSDATD